MKLFYIIFTLIISLSCEDSFRQKDVFGLYAAVGYKNTFDTIVFRPKGVYERMVYDKNSNCLLKMRGKWVLIDDNEIKLESFYLNLDDDLVSFPTNVNDTNMSLSAILEGDVRKITFCVGYLQGQNCYRKIE